MAATPLPRYDNAPYLDLKNYLNNQSFTTIDSHNFMLGETHTFTPNFLTNFRFGIARDVSDRGPASSSIGVGFTWWALRDDFRTLALGRDLPLASLSEEIAGFFQASP